MVANEQVFYRYVELHGRIGTNMERTELMCSSGQQQQQQRSATTTRSRHSPRTHSKGWMPKNQTTKATTKAVSTVGPYQVRGGLKGSSSSSSQERVDKPTGTSSVSRSKSSSQQQNDGRPESSSSGGSKQQDHGITARPGEQISLCTTPVWLP
jgi:hypothetical protein